MAKKSWSLSKIKKMRETDLVYSTDLVTIGEFVRVVDELQKRIKVLENSLQKDGVELK